MSPSVQIASAFVGTLGFAMVFGAKKKYWLLIAVDGALSWTLYLCLCNFMSSFFANLITAAFCSLYAHIAARIVKAPTTCLLMPATVPMIPGGSLYYTMFYALRGDMEEFQIYLKNTAKTIFAMAIGFALISLFFRIRELERIGRD
ncbi:MAG: threonine/serine exporter family protein [Lachnospiraceae bacterium]|nr:threonine/serine exporter family protein [Lachnospiraceae bacterium]